MSPRRDGTLTCAPARRSELGKRLARRDELALELLQLHKRMKEVQAQRAEAGKEIRCGCRILISSGHERWWRMGH